MQLTSLINGSSLQVHLGSWTPPRLDVDVMFCSYTFDGDGDSGIAANPKGVSFVHFVTLFPLHNIWNFYVKMIN